MKNILLFTILCAFINVVAIAQSKSEVAKDLKVEKEITNIAAVKVSETNNKATEQNTKTTENTNQSLTKTKASCTDQNKTSCTKAQKKSCKKAHKNSTASKAQCPHAIKQEEESKD